MPTNGDNVPRLHRWPTAIQYERHPTVESDNPPDPSLVLTGQIINSASCVYRRFGYGFLEAVYRRTHAVEMQYQGVGVSEETPFELFHRGVSVGFYRADLVAERRVIVEVKTGLVLDPVSKPQLLNYLRAADLSLGSSFISHRLVR